MRTQQGLTTKELARRMGRRHALSRLLHAEHPNPRFDTLAALLAAVNITAEVRLRRAHDGEPPIQVIEVDAIDPEPAQLTG